MPFSAAMSLLMAIGLGFSLSRAEEAPEIFSSAPNGITDVADGGVTTFTMKGGATDPPPSDYGTGKWERTGIRLYQWHITVTESVEGGLGPTHPFDGVVTTNNQLSIPNNQPGRYTVSASLGEEWRDQSDPPIVIIWPPILRSEKEAPPHPPNSE